MSNARQNRIDAGYEPPTGPTLSETHGRHYEEQRDRPVTVTELRRTIAARLKRTEERDAMICGRHPELQGGLREYEIECLLMDLRVMCGIDDTYELKEDF